MNTEPDTKILAKSAEASYSQSRVPTPDYVRQDHLSSADISVYKHKVQPHTIISHRGTDVGSNSIAKQLQADFNIAIGNKSVDKLHNERTKKTEAIMRRIKQDNPDHSIHLASHSLGGSSQQQAMIKSAYVRDNAKSSDTFNAGSSLLGGKGLSAKNPAYADIAKKQINHSVYGDAISENVDNSMIGKVKRYDNKRDKSIGQQVLKFAQPYLQKSMLGRTVSLLGKGALGTQSSHSLRNFTQ